MFVEMTCNCGASFQMDVETSESTLMMFAHKFTTSHELCGYMAPTAQDISEKTKRYDITYRERKNEPEEM